MVNKLFRGRYLAIAAFAFVALLVSIFVGFVQSPSVSADGSFQATGANSITGTNISSECPTVAFTDSGGTYKGTCKPQNCVASRLTGSCGTVITYTITNITASGSGYTATLNGPGVQNPSITISANGQKQQLKDSSGTVGKNKCPSGATETNGSCVCPDGNAPTNGSCPADPSSCGGGSFDWIICPAVSLFQNMAQKMLEFIQSLLTINTGGIFGQSDQAQAYYRAWNSFRILGTALIVIGGLVMISAQAFGFEFLDAYTIRKVLPRLFIAVIGMSLSWPILNFVISFFNTVGQDIQGLMYAPFSSLPNHAQASSAILSWGFITVIAALMVAGFGAVLLPILGTGALALLIAILVLIIRQIGVTLLVILAPFAIAAYVLPNTKKLWDIWKDNFLGLMFMYPIIMMLIAAGEIFGAVGKSGDFVWQIVGIVAFFVPFFMIPLAFRMATGFISQISGIVNDRSKGAFDRLRNARGNIAKNRAQSLRDYNRFKGGTEHNRRGKFNKALGRLGNINQAGFNPARMRGNMEAFESRHGMGQAAEHLEKNAAMGMIKGNEEYLYAALASHGDEGRLRSILKNEYGYEGAQLEGAVAQIRNARQGVSDEVFEKSAALGIAASGTGLKEREVKRATLNADGSVARDANGGVVWEYQQQNGSWATGDQAKANAQKIKGGAGELNNIVNEVWGKDRVGAASGLVAARGMAGQARRFDISGNSTGTALGLLEAQYNYTLDNSSNQGKIEVVDTNGNKVVVGASADAITKTTVKQALEGQGGSYVAGSRKAAVEAFAPEMLEKLQTVANTGNTRNMDQELAAIAGRYDAMSSVAPENARVLADKVLGQKLAGSNQTVQELIEARRLSPEFLEMRREYGAAARQGGNNAQLAAQLSAMQAQAGTPQGPVQPPPLPPVTGGF